MVLFFGKAELSMYVEEGLVVKSGDRYWYGNTEVFEIKRIPR